MSSKSEKSAGIAYLAWCGCFWGICGLQRFYLGRTTEGLIYVFTVGFFFIGQVADLFLIPSMINERNKREVTVNNAIKQEQNVAQTVNINIGEEIKSALTGIQNPHTQQPTLNQATSHQLKASSNLDIEILKLCKKQESVTLTDCIIETNSVIEEVENSLDRLMQKNLIMVDNHSVDGKVVYRLM